MEDELNSGLLKPYVKIKTITEMFTSDTVHCFRDLKKCSKKRKMK